MKVLLFLLVFFHICFISFSQQEPIFNLNETNQSFYNPSTTAVYDHHLVNTQYRNQWIGFNGSPITYLLNYEMDIDKINSGIGLVAMRDEIGLNTNYTIGLNYRYTFNLGEFSKLSAGIGINWFHQRFSNGWVTPNSTNDPHLPQPSNSSWNVNSGLHFQRKKLTIGLGWMNVISAFRNQSAHHPYHKALHTNLFADYTFEVTQHFALTPSFLILTDWNRITSLLAVKGLHYNRFWWQIGYRQYRALNIGVGIQFWNRLHVGAIYEHSFAQYLVGFNSTFEAYIAFRLKK